MASSQDFTQCYKLLDSGDYPEYRKKSSKVISILQNNNDKFSNALLSYNINFDKEFKSMSNLYKDHKNVRKIAFNEAKDSVLKNIDIILELIGKREGGSDYNEYYGSDDNYNSNDCSSDCESDDEYY